MKRFRRSSAVLAAALVFAAAPVLRGAEPLRWKFKAGDVYRFENTQAMTSTLELGGASTVTKTDLVMEVVQTIDGVDADGSADISQKIARVRFKVNMGNVAADYDSEAKDTPAGFAAMVDPLFKAMQSGAFKLKMTPRGEVTVVDVPAEVLDAMKNAPGANALGEMATEEGFKKLVSQASLVLPEKLEAGTEWSVTSESKVPDLGMRKAVITYRYAGPKAVDGQEMESFIPQVEVTFEGNPDPAGPQLEVVSQESTGEALFNRTAGRIESTVLHQKMEMKVTANGVEVVQKLDQTSEFKWAPEKKSE